MQIELHLSLFDCHFIVFGIIIGICLININLVIVG